MDKQLEQLHEDYNNSTQDNETVQGKKIHINKDSDYGVYTNHKDMSRSTFACYKGTYGSIEK